MAVLMLSLTGIPPTVGFFAKLYVLLAAVDSGLAWLAVIIVLNAAMAAFYYLRVVVYMYMRDPEPDPAPIDTSSLRLGGPGALGGWRRDPRALPRRHPEPARGVGGEPLLSRMASADAEAADAALGAAAAALLGDRRLIIATNRGPVTFVVGRRWLAPARDAAPAGSSPRSARSAATFR